MEQPSCLYLMRFALPWTAEWSGKHQGLLCWHAYPLLIFGECQSDTLFESRKGDRLLEPSSQACILKTWVAMPWSMANAAGRSATAGRKLLVGHALERLEGAVNHPWDQIRDTGIHPIPESGSHHRRLSSSAFTDLSQVF
jgi:hypothetical protein